MFRCFPVTHTYIYRLMLQILRKKSQSTFIQIIVVVIALVFIFWGVGTNLSGNRQAALMVNGEEISFQQFQTAYDRAYQRFSDQFGGNVPKGLAESFGIKQQVINQLIQTTLLRQGAEQMGIHISGEEVGDFIKDMVQFQEDGVFNMDKYKSVLAANRMAATKFENSMKYDRLAEVATREVGNFSAIATDFEVQDLYGKINEKINLTYIKISPDAFKEDISVDEEQLLKWFDSAQDKYKTEPQVKLKYLPFTFSNIAQKIEIEEAKLQEYYKENPTDFTVPEKRHARHILLKADEAATDEVHAAQLQKAKDILAQLKNGADFIELAKSVSEGPSKSSGGDLGYFSAGQMVQPFNDAVFAMETGDISDVVKTQFGYHIILLEDIQPATTKPFNEVSEQIKEKLQLKEAKSLAFQVANAAYEGIIGAGSLTKYTEATPDTEVKESDFFTKDTAPDDLKGDAQFLTKAFELKKGELSSLIKGNTGYIILYAEDIKEPEIPEFSSVKEKVTQDYKTSKSQEMAENEAKQFLAKLKDGEDFTALAKDRGIELQESGLLSQNNQENNSEFPSSLIKDAFLLSPADPVPDTPGKDGNDFYIYRYLEQVIPPMPDDAGEVKKYEQNLRQFKQRQLLSAWLKNLESKAEITQHQSLLQ